MDVLTLSGVDVDVASSTFERRRARRGWYRVYCVRCCKCIKFGVVLSFIFFFVYVVCVSGVMVFVVYVFG